MEVRKKAMTLKGKPVYYMEALSARPLVVGHHAKPLVMTVTSCRWRSWMASSDPGSINRVLKSLIDWCKWTWPMTYLPIIQGAF